MVGLYPVPKGDKKPHMLAAGVLAVPAGQERTLAFDITAEASAAIAPGDYDLVVVQAGQKVDSYRVRFVHPEQPAGGGRWAHTMPYGTGGGWDGGFSHPIRLAQQERHIDDVLKRIHNANLWVQFFANAYPISGPSQNLPRASTIQRCRQRPPCTGQA